MKTKHNIKIIPDDLDMKKSGVYKIYNTLNEYCYIGSTSHFSKRLALHVADYKRNKANNPLSKFINDYSDRFLEFEILEITENNKDVLVDRENYWIRRYDFELLWNIAPEAGSNLGTTRSDKFKKKLSERQKGSNNSFYGKHHTSDTIEKIRSANTGENNHNYGKAMTEIQKQKLRELHTGKRHTSDTIEKLRELSSGSNNPMAKKVICTETDKRWDCAKYCAEELNINYATLCNKLSGRTFNNTTLQWEK